jgi:hypothetical protein
LAAFFSGTIFGDALGVVKACTRFFLNENGVEKIELKEEREKTCSNFSEIEHLIILA